MHARRFPSYFLRLALVLLAAGGLIHLPAPHALAQGDLVSVSFQDGAAPSSAYAGTSDAYLYQNYPTSNYGGGSSLRVDGDEPTGTGLDLSTLLRWDISTIPPGSQVVSVTITVQVTNATAVPYPVYALKRAWVESQANWTRASTSTNWESAGAASALDRDATVLGNIAASALGSYTLTLNSAGVAVVQGWVDAPGSNFGLIAADTVISDGLTFLSSENTTVSSRPRLTVNYLPPSASTATSISTPLPTNTATGTATAAPTATATATATSSPTVLPTSTATLTPTATASPVPSSAPKYVILYIGDGMGFEHVNAASIYQSGSPGRLNFESFPYRAEMTTRSVNTSPTDSAAASTAMATGVKVYNNVISVANPGDGHELETLLEQAQRSGKETGLVTTSFATDATPAGFGAHELLRTSTAAIAGDYLNQTRPQVLLGGGGNGLTPETAQAAGYTVTADRAGLLALDGSTPYVSGQFTTGRMPYEYDGLGAYPHLSEMTRSALDLLDDDPDGFFLMVEGGLIDPAAHSNDLPRDIAETLELANAVQVGLDWAAGRSDVLILVTADHETGGLTVTSNNGTGVYPTVTWSTTGHTAANVPVYAIGAYADQVYGTIDNTEIPAVVNGARGASPTATPIPAETATAAPTSTFTPTLTPSLTPVFTATATAAASATAAATATQSAQQVLAFQQGVAPSSSYDGTTDTYILQRSPTGNRGGTTPISLSGSDPLGTGYDTHGLLRWDVSAIPPGRQVIAASITFSISNGSTQAYNLYALLRSWSESSATWNQAAAGTNWQLPGAGGSLDHGTALLGSLKYNSLGSYTIPLTSAGVALVQSWVDNPAANFGIIITGPANTNNAAFASSENTTPASRPRLEITYR